ncbi:hypothetical protein CRG98_027846 [Punica granatum]|uniref:RNase H type-1 domain-containing protein n=1 Tax=Punica granatum TaxID=22663 RepID=A0A2I0J6D1_PUNGR|nr:hypothetical protein CRG98_027846 [Punica granatum]
MCCALVWGMQKLRQYTLYHTVHLLSKMDPLKYLLGSPSSMRNIEKWRCQLKEYNIEYVSRTSVKGQAIADHLAEFPIDDDTPINSDFPDEGILQMLKQWKTKDPKLVSYHEYLEELTENFENVSFTYTPRTKNQFANALATLASMVSIMYQNLIEPIKFEIAKGPAHCDMIKAVDGKPCDETLYRRSFDATLLQCVNENEAQRFMEEVHEGNCGPHMNGFMLAKKLVRLGYF